MENKYFSLEIRDDNKITKVFRIIFGLICIAIAVFWLIFNFHSEKSDKTIWITVLFLIAFGAFQVYSGFGYATKYIEFQNSNIKLKKNSILPAIDFPGEKTEKIILFPLKAEFFMRNSKSVILRFGITDPGKIEVIKEELISYAEIHNINLEINTEEIV